VSAARQISGVRADAARIAIYFADLNLAQSALEDAERQTPRLSPDQIERYENRASLDREDAALWRLAHIALRVALERHAGEGARRTPYAIEAGGRPYLLADAHLHGQPHFSLAHAGPYALIAISHAGPAGVDLETERQLNVSAERRQRIEAVAARLAPDGPLPKDPDARFLQAWVRLEAAAKASGAGIGRILTGAGIVGGAQVQPGVTSAYPGEVRDLVIGSGCFAAIAAAELPPILTVEDFPTDALGLSRFLKPVAGQ
jgi:phosphopantetheinyl transferase